MFRKEIVALGATALAVFALVAGAASLAIRAVEHDAKLVAQDTLPGLVNAGAAINRINENWFNTSLILNTPALASRSNLIAQINLNSTEAFWDRYGQSILGQQDADSFKAMQKSRTEFIALRERYFTLIGAANLPEAKRLYESQLKPAFTKYREDAVGLFMFNANVGQDRADRIIHFSKWTPFALAGFSVLVLLIGVFVGFKASLGAFSGAWNEHEQKPLRRP